MPARRSCSLDAGCGALLVMSGVRGVVWGALSSENIVDAARSTL
jgi:hypothetical protein